MPNVTSLLDLPTEIRLSIYQFALAPTGVLFLRSTEDSRFSVFPVVSPLLLASCKQIHAEASDILYAHNEICIIMDAHDTCSPVIAERRLSLDTVHKIQHLCLILNCTGYFCASYDDVNWTPLEALTSLKSLRLSLVYRQLPSWAFVVPTYGNDTALSELLRCILERIPASAQMTYSIPLNSQQASDMQRLLNARAWQPWGVNEDLMIKDLRQIAWCCQNVNRGSRSGKTGDVYAEARNRNSASLDATAAMTTRRLSP